MANLEQLIAGHAYWIDRRKELQRQFGVELFNCNGMHKKEVKLPSFIQTGDGSIFLEGVNCFKHVYEIMKEGYHPAYPDEELSFNEIWSGMHEHSDGVYWTPCKRCRNAYEIRVEKVMASRHVGAIRAAITRVGRTIEYRGRIE